jgi:hypothetical protein
MNNIHVSSHYLRKILHQLIKAETKQRNFKQFVPLDLPIKKTARIIYSMENRKEKGVFQH